MSVASKHFVVQGVVQGVCFRSATQSCANILQLKGWVRNTEACDVEIVACGPKEKLAEFEAWLNEGSVFAHVNKVIAEDIQVENYKDFSVR